MGIRGMYGFPLAKIQEELNKTESTVLICSDQVFIK